MHIAQIAPLTEAVPPKLYGGTERVIYWLTEELVALGHEVTLFASGDSRTSAKLEAMWPKALRHDGRIRDANALHMTMLEKVRRRAADFDFLHFHLDYYPFSLFSRQSTPFVTTLHGRLDLAEHQPVFDTFSSAPLVSISDAQRRPVPPGGFAPSITAFPSACSRRGRSNPTTLPFSAVSPPRKRSIVPSALPPVAGCRSRSPPRSTDTIKITLRSRSGRLSVRP